MIILAGGNGSSKEQSIIILNAKTEREVADAEYNYLEEILGKKIFIGSFCTSILLMVETSNMIFCI